MMQNWIGMLAAVMGLSWFAFAANASSFNLNLNQTRYLGAAPSSSQSSNYTFLSGDLNLGKNGENFKFKFNPVAQNAIGIKNEFYLGVPEAFVEPVLGGGFGLVIGRQKRTWSRLDEEFNLGVWQPQLRWDYLEPKQQGLIGVFFDIDFTKKFRMTFLFSPLFLPDQGPNYSLSDGQFSSRNRWFSQPQSRVALFSDTGVNPATPLYFQIDRPSEESVVMKTSLGLGLNYRGEGGFWTNLNYVYKPQNQLHLGIECTNCLNIGGPLEVTALIHPIAIHHHVLTLESGYEKPNAYGGYVSLTADVPNSSPFPATYAESPLDSMLIAGGAFEHSLTEWTRVPASLKYSYIRVINIRSKDRRSLVDAEQVHSSLDRYPYREVAAIDGRVRLYEVSSHRIRLRTRYSYSVPEKGGWVSAALDYNHGPMTLYAGADVLGTGVADDSTNAGLFTKYRSNDRIFGGVDYVF